MTGRRTLEVELCGHASLVRGHESRMLVEEVMGRAPVWISRLRGWSVQEKTARDVMALAETRGFNVIVSGPRSRRQVLLDLLNAAPPPRTWEPGGADALDGAPVRDRTSAREPAEGGLW